MHMNIAESSTRLGAVRHLNNCVAVIALTTAVLGMQSRAENPKAGSPGAPDHESAANFTLENDSFFHTDHFYTNGAQIEVKQRTDARFELTKDTLAALCRSIGCVDDALLSTRFRLGQLMYTPTKIGIAQPQPEDRPWAGLLYYAHDYLFRSADERTLTTVTGLFGVTGPASLSDQTQHVVHRLGHFTTPQGWSNQIGPELGLLASVEKKRAWSDAPLLGTESGAQVRGNWYWRLAAGNVQTYAALGATLVAGKRLPIVGPREAGSIVDKVMKLEPAPAASPADTSCLVGWLQCSAFFTLEGRAMAYNVFLQGRMFGDDPHVTPQPFVYDAMLGVRLDFPNSSSSLTGPWFVQFKATRRSPEFRSTVAHVPSQSFGALTIGTEF